MAVVLGPRLRDMWWVCVWDEYFLCCTSAPLGSCTEPHSGLNGLSRRNLFFHTLQMRNQSLGTSGACPQVTELRNWQKQDSNQVCLTLEISFLTIISHLLANMQLYEVVSSLCQSEWLQRRFKADKVSRLFKYRISEQDGARMSCLNWRVWIKWAYFITPPHLGIHVVF